MLSNPSDPADEAYNYVEFALTLGLLEVYEKQPNLFNNLRVKVANTTNKCYNMVTFANDYPQINQIFDSVFSTRFSDFANYGNWQLLVNAKYKYDINYVPFARFINYESPDLNLPAYVAAPFEIDEDKFLNFDDNFPL